MKAEEDGKKGLEEIIEIRRVVNEIQESNAMELHKWDAKLRYFKQ